MVLGFIKKWRYGRILRQWLKVSILFIIAVIEMSMIFNLQSSSLLRCPWRLSLSGGKGMIHFLLWRRLHYWWRLKLSGGKRMIHFLLPGRFAINGDWNGVLEAKEWLIFCYWDVFVVNGDWNREDANEWSVFNYDEVFVADGV